MEQSVQKGDTLSGITQKYNISPADFLKYNPQYKASGALVGGKNLDWQGLTGLITPGQKYKIPGLQQPPSVVNGDAAKKDLNKIQGDVSQFETNQIEEGTPSSAIGKLNKMADDEYTKYSKQLEQIASGANLSAGEKATLASLQGVLNQSKVAQEEVNEMLQSGMMVAGIRSGRSQYSPETQAALMHNAMSKGIMKIQALDIRATAEITKTRQAMIDGNLKAAKESHQAYLDMIKERKDDIYKLSDMALKQQEFLLKQQQAGKTSLIKEYEYAQAQGYKGGLTDFMNVRKTISSAFKIPKFIDSKTASSAGFPKSMIGMSSSDILNSLSEDYPPMWFSDYVNKQLGKEGVNYDDINLYSYWDKFKTSDLAITIKNTVKPDTGSDGNIF